MKYEEALEYVESLSTAGIKPGLSNIINLCEIMGNPQEQLKFVMSSSSAASPVRAMHPSRMLCPRTFRRSCRRRTSRWDDTCLRLSLSTESGSRWEKG